MLEGGQWHIQGMNELRSLIERILRGVATEKFANGTDVIRLVRIANRLAHTVDWYTSSASSEYARSTIDVINSYLHEDVREHVHYDQTKDQFLITTYMIDWPSAKGLVEYLGEL